MQGGWEQYVENYCFVENTYWVKMYDDIPHSYKERDGRELQYYQWVPFVLALQALLFYIPRMIWKMLNWQTGCSYCFGLIYYFSWVLKDDLI